MYRALLELLISAIGPCSIFYLIGVGDFAKKKKKQIAQSSNEAEIFLLVLIRIVISPILNKSLVSFHKPYYFQQ
jgi:ABC-type amino acid transport system permease subunit